MFDSSSLSPARAAPLPPAPRRPLAAWQGTPPTRPGARTRSNPPLPLSFTLAPARHPATAAAVRRHRHHRPTRVPCCRPPCASHPRRRWQTVWSCHRRRSRSWRPVGEQVRGSRVGVQGRSMTRSAQEGKQPCPAAAARAAPRGPGQAAYPPRLLAGYRGWPVACGVGRADPNQENKQNHAGPRVLQARGAPHQLHSNSPAATGARGRGWSRRPLRG